MISLMSFLRGSSNPKDKIPGCANYDQHHGGCLFNSLCRVESGLRCGYFEQAVLPTASDTGQLDHIRRKYLKHLKLEFIPALEKYPEVRSCACGVRLNPHQRYCDKCAKKQTSKAYKKYRENKRLMRHS